MLTEKIDWVNHLWSQCLHMWHIDELHTFTVFAVKWLINLMFTFKMDYIPAKGSSVAVHHSYVMLAICVSVDMVM